MTVQQRLDALGRTELFAAVTEEARRELATTAQERHLVEGEILFCAGEKASGLFVVVAEFHLAEDALTLHLLFQRPKGLIDIVIADDDLQRCYLRLAVDVLEWRRGPNLTLTESG